MARELHFEYLSEKGLGEYIKRRFSSFNIISNKSFFKDNGYTFRSDFIIKDLNLIFEFDGYYHYNDNKTILSDIDRDEITKMFGFNTIRIPYFVQLTEQTIEYYFKNFGDRSTVNKIIYPHGFIDDNVILPGRYTTLGANKFFDNLIGFTKNEMGNVTNDIIFSLYEKWYVKKNIPFLHCFPVQKEIQFEFIEKIIDKPFPEKNKN